ncbi:hypothetical protein [Chondrinema litorale]|uniref:hypothetical protein n=1 Tax=Chondrinema litorale TaxID=2994555 RepID=UPI002542B543|nr:hypothetical protein [Chondrinema litorale]UZR95938.1 hypothetical protein OQ292_08945 [Chondrinema litorale]
MKKEHYNIPQILFYAILAKVNVLIWGRATGKTTGPGAMFSHDNITKMPRSIGGFVNVSYEKLLTVLLPAVVSGWEKLGYQRDVHFFIKKFPPKKWNWPSAYLQPLKPDHYISWYNGSGVALISLDRPGTYNGGSIDWLYADEARYLNKKRLDQVLLTIRGNAEHFQHLSNHGSILFTSDMPQGSSSKWLLDFYEQMDGETIELILSIQHQIIELSHHLREKPNQRGAEKILQKIKKFESYINELRKNTVYFSTASTFDNIHALGLDVIKNFKRTLSDLEFQMSVLNKEISKIENGFYGLFDEEIHGYVDSNFSHIDQLDLTYTSSDVIDCRWDSDFLQYEPLDIACDYNSAINWVVIGQDFGNEYKILNSLFVKHPLRIKNLVKKFCDYYKYKPLKKVNYYFDHTAIPENAKDDVTFADEWCNALMEYGWEVNRIYMGQAPSHKSRYTLFQKTFAEDEEKLSKFRINLNRNKQLIVSLQGAGLKQGKTGFEKDKTPEKDPKVKPEDATHGSEALDTLWYATQRWKLDSSSTGFMDVMY